MLTVPDETITLASEAFSGVDRVLVGVDDSGSGLAALAAAIMLARSQRAQLVAVRCWALGLPRHGGRRMRHLSHPHVVLSFSGAEQCEAAEMLVRNAFASVAGGTPADLALTIETPEGDPGVVLAELASRPRDVLVLGTNPGHPARRLVHGSVGRYCAKHASCPVLVVPPVPAASRAATA